MKFLSILTFVCFLIIGCKKKDSTSNFWKVRYEITSTNPSVKISVVFRDESGNIRQSGDPTNPVTYQTVPWNYEADFSKDPAMTSARGLTVYVFDATNYTNSDLLTAKIFVDGRLVSQSSRPGVLGISADYYLNN